MAPESVLVAGASGRTGREVVGVARGAGLRVRGQSTSEPGAAEAADAGADETVVADLMEPADAARAAEGADAVVCAVGAPPGPNLLFGEMVDGRGTVNLVEAAVGAGVDRFVLVSSLGVGDSRPGMPLPLRAVLWRVLRAKGRAERALRAADLVHTILRPGGLTDGEPTGDVVVAEGGDTVAGTVPRGDLARVAVAALFTPAVENRTLEVVARAGLRGEATGVVGVDWHLPGHNA